MKKNKIHAVLLVEDSQKTLYFNTSLYEFVRYMILLLGILLSFQDLMYTKTCLIISIIAGAIVMISRKFSHLFKSWEKRIDLILYCLGLLCLAVSNFSLIQAIFDLANRFIMLYNARFDTSFERFAVDSRAALGSIILWILLGGIISDFIYRQMKKQKLYGIVIILLLSILFGFVIGNSSMLLPALLIVISISNLFVYDCAPKREIGSLFFVCKLLSLMFIAGLFMISSVYTRSDSLEIWKIKMSDRIDEIRYGKDSLPKGNLYKTSNLLNGEEKRLSIEIDQPQELYLRGFVGGSYENNQWKSLSSEHYEGDYEGILNWLSKKNFNPLTQYVSYKKINADYTKTALDYTKINVTNTGAYRKYIYLPMTVSAYEAFHATSDKDYTTRSNRLFGTYDYKFQSIYYSQDILDTTPASWLTKTNNDTQKEYQQAESVYNKFVESSYKEFDPSLKKLIRTTFFKDNQKMNFKETTTRIRQILRQKIKYNESPNTVPSNEDYITWLLKNGKEGNAISYATTAVMAYRSAGYPARYVEGYHLSNEEAKILTKNHQQKAILTTQNAHAWVEVYRSGIGWIPVEVVPGMYTETYSTQTVKGKPSYQLKSKKDKSGVNTEEGKSGKRQKDNERSNKSFISVQNIITLFLMICYFVLIIYLLLELQRRVRLYFWNKKYSDAIDPKECADILEQLWILSKIKGDYSKPLSLEAAIIKAYPQVNSFEYRRVITLIQKSRFGGKTLKPYENHTLICFIHKISHLLWRKQSFFGKILLRYVYIIPKR